METLQIPVKHIQLKRGQWVCWKKPQIGSYKLNTDGSRNGQYATGGGVIRDHNGHFVAGFTNRYGNIDIVAAELRALYDGIQLGKQMGIHGLEVETDSQLALTMIKEDKCKGSMTYLVRKCRREIDVSKTLPDETEKILYFN